MSGHSKWSTIKHRKGAQDAKRGKIFTKIIREIIVATREGGDDATLNPRLRAALANARAENMPKDTVQRAIDRGIGANDSDQYFEMLYEGYGPSAVAIIASALTDNKNRTVAEVRGIFHKYGGRLGESGSVSYLFETKGMVTCSAEKYSEADLLETALELGAEDLFQEQAHIGIICEPKSLHALTDGLVKANIECENSMIVRIPQSHIHLEKEAEEKALKMIESLEDLDDIQEVYSNMQISDSDAKR